MLRFACVYGVMYLRIALLNISHSQSLSWGFNLFLAHLRFLPLLVETDPASEPRFDGVLPMSCSSNRLQERVNCYSDMASQVLST